MRPNLPRLLLCLSLLGFGSAVAAESRHMGPDEGGGQAEAPTGGSDRADDEPEAGTLPTRRAGDAKPRPAAASRNGSTTRASAPRWHSFLPGMIR